MEVDVWLLSPEKNPQIVVKTMDDNADESALIRFHWKSGNLIGSGH